MAERLLAMISNGEIESFKARGKSINKGYMVFAFKLSNLLIEASQKRPVVAEYSAGKLPSRNNDRSEGMDRV